MKVEIDRATWRTGGHNPPPKYGSGRGNTALLNDEGFRCCLGFHGAAAGVDDHYLLRKGEPISIVLEYNEPDEDSVQAFIEAGLIHANEENNTAFAADAIYINDRGDLSRNEREKRLVALAKEHGHEWVFVGEYPA